MRCNGQTTALTKEKKKVADNGVAAGGAPSDVLITDATAVNLHAHLVSQGRFRKYNSADIKLMLGTAVERSWGTNKAPRFNDDLGGGWTVDLSDWLEGEMMYALIRTVHGRRTLATVVEVDEFEEFAKTGKWKSQAAQDPDAGIVDAETLAEAQAIEQGKVPPAPIGAGPPQKRGLDGRAPGAMRAPDNLDDPMLLVLRYKDRDVCVRCKRSEVPLRVREWLSQDEVTEDDIEIWSHVSKPKVTIQF